MTTTTPDDPAKPEKPKKRPPRVVVPARFNPESLPAIDRTAKHLGLNRSELIRRGTFEMVQRHDPERKRR